ncbi:hypothetical protein BSU04nite_17380 [Bacillus spizizenii]|nr:hypothetical protein BSU04nite_17380 [Bacillus spizizenii]
MINLLGLLLFGMGSPSFVFFFYKLDNIFNLTTDNKKNTLVYSL